MNKTTHNQIFQVEKAAKQGIDYGSEKTHNEASAEIAGHTLTVKVHVADRKCYDGMSTPTAVFFLDGKRTKRADVYSMLCSIEV